MSGVILAFLASTMRIATPMALAAMGGIITELSGVFAIGLEGMMLCGAFGAATGTFASGNVVLGLLASLLAGGVLGIIVCIPILRLRADQMVTGLAANMLAAGATSFLLRALHHGQAPVIRLPLLAPLPIPLLSQLPVLGPLLFRQQPLTYLAFGACLPLAWFLRRTHAGLVLRAGGENPAAAFVMGLDPARIRLACTVAGAAIAGLGGAVLVLQQVGTFTDMMTGGRGFLALAAIIVGRWHPVTTVLVCLVFGATEALELRVETLGLPVSSYAIEMLPYLIALLVLTGFGRSTGMPAALGHNLPSRGTR